MSKIKDISGLEESGESSGRPKGNNHLLAIAINQYDEEKGIPSLSNCVKDAEDFIAELVNRYRFSEERVIRIFDTQATKENIYKKMRELRRRVKENDNVIIYFSGHGFYDKEEKSGHLIPVDGKKDAIWTYMSNANLLSQIRAINSFHTLLILDSCFSGSLFATKGIQAKSYEDKIGNFPSRLGFAAGMIETVTDGFHGENSPFAKALITFLKNNRKEKIAASQLMEYVKRATSNNALQTPIGGPLFKVGDMDGQFIFALQKNEAADWKKASSADTLASYQHFLLMHPDGAFSDQAQEKITAIEAAAVWAKIQNMPDEKDHEVRQKIIAIHDFLGDFQKVKEVTQAEELGEQLEYKEAFLNIQDKLFALKRFAQKNTPFKAAALDRVKVLEEEIERERQKKKEAAVKEKLEQETIQLKEQQDKQKIADRKQEEKRQHVTPKKEKEPTPVVRPPKKPTPSFLKKYGKYIIPLILLPFIVWGVNELLQPEPALEIEMFQDPTSQLWGYNKGTETIIPAQYDQAGTFSNGQASVTLNGNSFTIDEEGNCIADCPPAEEEIKAKILKEAQDNYQEQLSKGDTELRKASPNFLSVKQHYQDAINAAKGFDIDTQDAKDGIQKCEAEIAKQTQAERENQKKAKAEQARKAEDSAWRKAKSNPSIKAYEDYQKKYPNGRYYSEAQKLINDIKEADRKRKEQEAEIKPAPTAANSGTFTDTRPGGQTYRWVRLKDGKKWMAENLNFKTTDSWCYDNKESNCRPYGRLYTWEAAKIACPPGWRLPSDAEWRNMAKYYGGCDDDASDGGKAAYQALIDGGNSSFSALLGGSRDSDGSFGYLSHYGGYWSSTEHGTDSAWYYYFGQPDSELYRDDDGKRWGGSCRCIQD